MSINLTSSVNIICMVVDVFSIKTNQLFLHDDLLKNFIAMRHKKARAAFVALANIESQKKLKLALNL